MKMRISIALPVLFLAALTLSIGAFFLLSYASQKASIEDRSNKILEDLLHSNLRAVEGYVRSAKSGLILQSNSPVFVKAVIDLSNGWARSDETSVLETFTSARTDRANILSGDGVELYEFMHEAHHPQIREYSDSSPFSDILLLNPEGQVVYSVHKGDEFGKKLGSSELLRHVKGEISSKVWQTDLDYGIFTPEQSDGTLLAMPMPIEVEGKLSGYIVGILPFRNFPSALSSHGTLGETGTISLRLNSGHVIASTRDIPASEMPAMEGDSEFTRPYVTEAMDGRLITVIREFLPKSDNKVQLVIQQENQELYADLNSLVLFQLLVAAFILATSGVVTFLLLKKYITNPLSEVSGAIDAVSRDQLEQKQELCSNFFEIHRIAEALDLFRDSAYRRRELEEESRKNLAARIRRSEEMQSEITGFKSEISEALSMLSKETEQMLVGATALREAGDDAYEKSQSAASLSSGSSKSVVSVADQTKTMATSIREIGSQSEDTNQMSNRAKILVGETRQGIDRLTETIQDVDKFSIYIRGISDQTKLLALNATIEAARAGEAGKGFAVVASEVKQLSNQTSQATEQISDQIKLMHQASSDAITKMSQVTDVIGEIEKSANHVVVAVERQIRTTNSMSEELNGAAAGSRSSQDQARFVAETLKINNTESERFKEVSRNLNGLSERISGAVEGFLHRVNG